jgi:hypothetical protein
MKSVSDILLATKVHIPPLHRNLVNRPHLIRRLNDGIVQSRRLTLISAPAGGYGKSTLLSEWVSKIGSPVAWLSLERGENTPARFWNYFFTALHTISHLRQELILPAEVLNPFPHHPSHEIRKYATFVKPIRKGVLSARQFPPHLKDSAGEFHKPPAW